MGNLGLPWLYHGICHSVLLERKVVGLMMSNSNSV